VGCCSVCTGRNNYSTGLYCLCRGLHYDEILLTLEKTHFGINSNTFLLHSLNRSVCVKLTASITVKRELDLRVLFR
jgi:hypothetical protein